MSCASAFTNVRVNSVEDNAVTVFTYPNGAIGVSETAFVACNNPFELEIVGDKGTILAGGVFDRLCYNIGDGWIYPNLPAALPAPIQMWMDALTKGGDIPYTIDDAVSLSRMMELAYSHKI
ncbi:MAG TPA: hypothetical protein DDY98_00675 [Ruminococcaceae bacterium]|nr:hypothetical protein [Oscillospiraceae bacterium]